MEFFNRKEEVIDIELTSHGKEMLSIGKFKPAFYAFYDDDITYDDQYGASFENQKDTHDRIVKTPRIKPNTVFESLTRTSGMLAGQKANDIAAFFEGLPEAALTAIGNSGLSSTDYVIHYLNGSGPAANERNAALIPDKKKEYALPVPLGTSDLGNQKAPAWQINFLRSELSSSVSSYVDGNRAVGELIFDVTTEDGTAADLDSVTFVLIDAAKTNVTFTFNKTADPSSGTCTSDPALICLDVNGDNSITTTSKEVAEQVKNKINAHPILITADIPNNDGIVRLRQDAAGDIGNTSINIGSTTGALFRAKRFKFGTDQTFAPLRIPQLFVDVYYDTSVGQGEPSGLQDPHNEVQYYDDGTYIKIDKDYILLDILEKNVPYDKENFEIEVYAMPLMYDKFTDPFGLSQSDELRKMKFASPARFTKFSTFLYDSVLKKSFVPDPSYTEYFFDITIDDEIQQDLSVAGINQAQLPVNDKELCEDQ